MASQEHLGFSERKLWTSLQAKAMFERSSLASLTSKRPVSSISESDHWPSTSWGSRTRFLGFPSPTRHVSFSELPLWQKLRENPGGTSNMMDQIESNYENQFLLCSRQNSEDVKGRMCLVMGCEARGTERLAPPSPPLSSSQPVISVAMFLSAQRPRCPSSV